MEYITIIIMTKSSKFSGKCVAGIDITNGKWVRLVSDDEETHGAISNEDLICQDGRICDVLDIVNVPILKRCGNLIQPENILIDNSKYITIKGKTKLSTVLKLHPAERRKNILGNEYQYITERKVESVGHSLTLIQVDMLKIIHSQNAEGKTKTKANFRYEGYEYNNMSVTDPDFYSIPNNTIYNKAFLVVSIGTPYNDKYYKFVSKIFV
ncbi:MAG: hypothetical protein MR691_08915 [Clostridium sp.]|nr:hypothetical protein [Clostridium sp.]